MYFFITKYK